MGWPQHRIASDLGISQPAVSKLLKRVDTRALRELNATIERQKVRQMQRLEHLYREAMHAWDESKADTTRRRQRKVHAASGGSGATLAEIVVENQHGDPRYLDEARKTLSDQRKLWGLDAPQQLDLRPVGNPYEGMSEGALREEVERQSRLLTAAEAVTLAPRSAPLGTVGLVVAEPEVIDQPANEGCDHAKHE